VPLAKEVLKCKDKNMVIMMAMDLIGRVIIKLKRVKE